MWIIGAALVDDPARLGGVLLRRVGDRRALLAVGDRAGDRAGDDYGVFELAHGAAPVKVGSGTRHILLPARELGHVGAGETSPARADRGSPPRGRDDQGVAQRTVAGSIAQRIRDAVIGTRSPLPDARDPGEQRRREGRASIAVIPPAIERVTSATPGRAGRTRLAKTPPPGIPKASTDGWPRRGPWRRGKSTALTSAARRQRDHVPSPTTSLVTKPPAAGIRGEGPPAACSGRTRARSIQTPMTIEPRPRRRPGTRWCPYSR